MERKMNVKNNAGFTLVELMVVVAIIGILATLAVPQYKKFQAKSRQSEARLSVGGAYTIEQSFAAENSSYTTCLGQAGYNRDGVRFYYNVGFAGGAVGHQNCGPDGKLACNYTSWTYDPDKQTYSPDPNTICDEKAQNMGVFLATAGEDGALVPKAGDPGTAMARIEKPKLDGGNAATDVSQQTFIIGAAGSILTAGAGLTLINAFDGWTIDQNKQLKNTQSGLF